MDFYAFLNEDEDDINEHDQLLDKPKVKKSWFFNLFKTIFKIIIKL